MLIFASEGDLWRTSRDGGTAVRLTNHPAEESEAHVSPDGRWIAFSASYGSDRDVYVMPVAGGAPRRLTFEGGFVQTIGWTPDGRVIFASRLPGGGNGDILHTVSPDGGEATPIPLWRATGATFGSDGRTLFFSRRSLYPLELLAQDNLRTRHFDPVLPLRNVAIIIDGAVEIPAGVMLPADNAGEVPIGEPRASQCRAALIERPADPGPASSQFSPVEDLPHDVGFGWDDPQLHPILFAIRSGGVCLVTVRLRESLAGASMGRAVYWSGQGLQDEDRSGRAQSCAQSRPDCDTLQ